MIPSLIAAVLIAIPAPVGPASEQRVDVSAPKLGGAGRFQDSNVSSVWRGVPLSWRRFGLCVRLHESMEQGHYRAHNGTSSAAGAYQMIDSTWRGNARWTKFRGEFVARKYAAANHAPAWVQDLVFVHSLRHGGFRNWTGTRCGYGT